MNSIHPERPYGARRPSGRRVWARLLVCAAALGLQGPAAGQFQERRIPVVDTGLEVLESFGRTGWLDARTYVVTIAHAKPLDKQAVHGRIVAFDVAANRASALYVDGRLNCIDAQAGLVSIATDNLEPLHFGGTSKSYTGPTHALFMWNAGAGRLVPKAMTDAVPFNPYICRQTLREDVVGKPAAGFFDVPRRYLRSQDGYLESEGFDTRSQSVTSAVWSVRPDTRAVQLQIRAKDVEALVPDYFPFARAHLIRFGKFLGGGTWMVGDDNTKVRQLPAGLLRGDGSATFELLPPDVVAQLDAAKVLQGVFAPAKEGILINTINQGILLARPGSLVRLWCPSTGRPGDTSCLDTGGLFEIAPDGCHVAVASQRSSPKHVHILNVCR